MTVTLRDIAKYTNVSVSTVSRALNDHQYVDEATRTLVREAAEELGYPLSNLRRASSASRLVLLLASDDNLPSEQDDETQVHNLDQLVANGARSIFEPCGIATHLQTIRMRAENAHLYAENPDIAGLILVGGVVDYDFVSSLLDTRVPFVIAGAHVHPLEVNCVMADYRYGMEQAVAHLIETGRRRIGLVNGPPTTKTSEEKYKSLRLTLALHNLDFTPAQVIDSNFDPEAGYAQTYELLERLPDVDAIIYCYDSAAMGGLRALKQSGRRVPEDVAVIGFHDLDLARYTEPPLTTVRFDMRLMGAIAARRLNMMLTEPDNNQTWFTLVPTSLVVREST